MSRFLFFNITKDMESIKTIDSISLLDSIDIVNPPLELLKQVFEDVIEKNNMNGWDTNDKIVAETTKEIWTGHSITVGIIKEENYYYLDYSILERDLTKLGWNIESMNIAAEMLGLQQGTNKYKVLDTVQQYVQNNKTRIIGIGK